MPKNPIPPSVAYQLRQTLNVDFTRYSRMRPRKLSLDGADVQFLLTIPPKNSKVVMQADFLAANVTLDNKAQTPGTFSKTSSVFDNGTKVTYQFKSWSEAETFLQRLPRKLPFNKVTFVSLAFVDGLGLCVEASAGVRNFFDHLDGGNFEYICSHQSVSGMKHFKNEMFTYGYTF